MSDDSKQLSVAELLARNGQGAAASSGGGRRRRGGRGISVADLTGDLPAIGGGHSSHARPDADEPQDSGYPGSTDYPGSGYESPSHDSYGAPSYESPAPSVPEPFDSYGSSDYGAGSSGYGAQYGSSYEPPAPPVSSLGSAPTADSYSPMSGPISMYDPLAGHTPDPMVDSRAGSRHGAPDDLLSVRGATDLYGPTPDRYAPGDPQPLPTGRRRRREADEESTEVRPMPGFGQADPDFGGDGSAWASRAPIEADQRPPLPERNGAHGGRMSRRREAEGFAPDAAPKALNGNGFGADAAPPRPQPNGANGAGALPAWSARRRPGAAPPRDPAPADPVAVPTAAWSLASQDQQLVSGPTVAGELLRESANGRNGGPEPAVYDGKTDVYEPIGLDELDDDLDQELDDDLDDELDDDLDDFEEEPSKLQALTTRLSAIRLPAALSPGASEKGGQERKSLDEINRRQWMILGGQSLGAAFAGMLLFKGFERMWEMLPWVALALAMIVILGLVALVRILRKTDDILSTVIAVVVGIFVTLGPLAFLLSTN